MQRYGIYQFDESTFVVLDTLKQREICVCSNYDDLEDAEGRAKKIAELLNANDVQ